MHTQSASALHDSLIFIGMDDTVVLIFAKAPIAGRTKSRLIPALGESGAARLHERMLTKAFESATRTGFAVELWATPDPHHAFFDALAQRFQFARHTQSGEDLGIRMDRALADALTRFGKAILIGTDCPFIDSADLHQANTMLTGSQDVVLGAASDGGYVMIGLTDACPALFHDMTWSTDTVAAETRQRIKDAGRICHELGPYHDIDRPADLNELSPRFANWLDLTN